MLPKDNKGPLNKTVLRAVWTNRLITSALGVQNEDEAREWFRLHPNVHTEFEKMNFELLQKIEELQRRAVSGLQEMVVAEHKAYGFGMDVVKEE